jgi:hypothetical protein
LSHSYKLKKANMSAPLFDPTRAVRFDLPRGTVRTLRDDDRVVLVPTAALDEVVRSAPPTAVEALGRALGAAIGRRAVASMGDPQSASIDAFVTHLAGEAAIAGVGLLGVERWGRAVVVSIEDSPLVGTLLAPLVASALEVASGRRVWCTLLSRDDHVARVLVGSEQAVGRVRGWIGSGIAWGEAVVKLHGGEA